jgi:IS1 family transposase
VRILEADTLLRLFKHGGKRPWSGGGVLIWILGCVVVFAGFLPPRLFGFDKFDVRTSILRGQLHQFGESPNVSKSRVLFFPKNVFIGNCSEEMDEGLLKPDGFGVIRCKRENNGVCNKGRRVAIDHGRNIHVAVRERAHRWMFPGFFDLCPPSAGDIEGLSWAVLRDHNSHGRPCEIKKLLSVKFVESFPILWGYVEPSTFFVTLRVGSSFSFPGLLRNSQQRQENSPSCRPVGPSKEAQPTWRVPFGVFYVFLGLIGVGHSGDSAITRLLGFLCGVVGCLFILNGYTHCQSENKRKSQQIFQHNGQIVPQKHLTGNSYWGTVIDMANVLNTDKQIAVIGALTEGSSIRSIERITGVHRDTIMRLGVKVGEGCARFMDTAMRDLQCNRLELDEIWGFVGKKDRNVREGEDGVGSVWTFCAIDAETKLVPAFKVGNRDVATATEFVKDVADRIAYRVQISTDGLSAYVIAMQNAFGEFVDYAQIIKTYGHEEVSDNRRYSAPKFVSSEKKIIVGNPDERLISTSYIERLNATTRLHMRRLTRLTLAFSKKRENFEAAVALHFAYYNFVKRHNTLRCTPAMAAGVTGNFWSVGDLVEAAA